jgi:hypothetical protein
MSETIRVLFTHYPIPTGGWDNNAQPVAQRVSDALRRVYPFTTLKIRYRTAHPSLVTIEIPPDDCDELNDIFETVREVLRRNFVDYRSQTYRSAAA